MQLIEINIDTANTLEYIRDCHESERKMPMAMTDAERQRKRRAKLKMESQKQLLVRGAEGEFDERIRVALAVKELATQGKLPKEVIELIVKTSETVFPTEELVNRKYINKIVSIYLKGLEK